MNSFIEFLKNQPGKYISICLARKDKEWLGDFWFTDPVDAYAFAVANKDSHNVYFATTKFSKKIRRKQYTEESYYLYSDLDTANPESIPNMSPSLIIESSKGRYQALWKLTKPIPLEQFETLNKLIALAYGGDTSGWDATQVLRVPGTKNYKYNPASTVKIIAVNSVEYDPKILEQKLKKIVGEIKPVSHSWHLPDNRWKDIYRRLPYEIKTKLFEEWPTTEDDRSIRVFWAIHRLVELKLEHIDIREILRRSPWNKFQGRNDELLRIEDIISKAKEKQETVEQKLATLPLITDSVLIARPRIPKQWLIEGIWGHEDYGFVLGEEKTMKSTIMLDFMLSIVTGTPFLHMHHVENSGNVVYIQGENDMNSIAANLGIIKEAKLQDTVSIKHGKFIINSRRTEHHKLEIVDRDLLARQGIFLDLLNKDHQSIIETTIEQTKPTAIVFDPLYSLTAVNLKLDEEVRPLFNWIKYLKAAYKCAVVIVHHFSKSSAKADVADRTYGTSAFNWFYESSLLIENMKKEKPKRQPKTPIAGSTLAVASSLVGSVNARKQLQEASGTPTVRGFDPRAHLRLSPKFRSFRPREPMELYLDLGTDDNFRYSVYGPDGRRLEPK